MASGNHRNVSGVAPRYASGTPRYEVEIYSRIDDVLCLSQRRAKCDLRVSPAMADTLTLTPERNRDAQVSVAAVFVVLDAGRPGAGSRHLLRGIERVVIGRG